MGGLVMPGNPLLGEGAGFVLGAASLQRRLLCEVQHFDRSRWAAVVALELPGQLTASALDAGSPCRPAPIQSRVDADDLSYRPEPRIPVGSFREPDAEGVAEVVFEGGVVCLRRSDGRL